MTKPYVGDTVKVTNGPFKGITGIVSSINSELVLVTQNNPLIVQDVYTTNIILKVWVDPNNSINVVLENVKLLIKY